MAVRTKAMKCLTAVVEADPSILARVRVKIVPLKTGSIGSRRELVNRNYLYAATFENYEIV